MFKLNKHRRFNYTPRFLKEKRVFLLVLNLNFPNIEILIILLILEKNGRMKDIKCEIERIEGLI